MKLHLGCGQRYLEGYLNIDFPSDKHTVQTTNVADVHADLRSLCYHCATFDEIRLHHVFEHFPRPVASGLLASWHYWLIPDGILHLEVPDFNKTAAVILDPLASHREKAVAERHLYGSHEAPWAAHCEGYTASMLEEMLEAFGFKMFELRTNVWRGTYNLEMLAKKKEDLSTLSEFRNRASHFLKPFLVDDSPSELSMLKAWLEIFVTQALRGGVLDG